MQPSAKYSWLAAVLFPFVMLLLFANALLSDTQTYERLLAPEAVPVTLELLRYFDGEVAIPAVFNAAEASHLADVKQTINAVRTLAWALLIVFLALLAFARADAGFAFSRGFGLLLLLIGVLAVVPFDLLFTRFHEILFAPGTWVFPADSTIIGLYPFAFFQAFFRELLTLSVVFSAALATISLVQNNNL